MRIVERCVWCGVMMLAGASVAIGADRGDWSQWRGANRDGRVPDFQPPQSWPSQLTQKWTAPVGSGDATPALVGDRLYAFGRDGADEVTTCISAVDGKTLWQDKYDPGVTVNGPAAGHAGPRSSPAVVNGRVVTLGVSGVLSCLDAANGTVAWRKQPNKGVPQGWPMFYVSSSPLVINDLCVAQLGGPGDGTLMAFDLNNGTERWAARTDAPVYASPAIMTIAGTQLVVAQTAKSLIGVRLADGKQLWQLSTPTRPRAQNAVSPVIDGDMLYLSGQGSGTRAVRIEPEGDAMAAHELWTNPDVTSVFCTPVLKDGMLFGLSDKNSFFCLDAKDGKTRWTAPSPRGGGGGRGTGFGSIVDAGQVLIALTPASRLIAIDPSPKEFHQVADVQIPGAQPYAYPVLAGHRVFIKGQQDLTMYTFE